MIQPRRRPGLAHQSFGIVHKEPTAKKFQRDLAIEVCIVGTIYLSHTTHAENGFNSVMCNVRTGGQ